MTGAEGTPYDWGEGYEGLKVVLTTGAAGTP